MSSFRVLLGIHRPPSGESVFFKEDGGRFGAERTIKLNLNCSYTLELTFRPNQHLQSLSVHGCNVHCDERKSQSAGGIVYEAAWNTAGLGKTATGKRLDVPIVIQLHNLPPLKMNLQCKLYPEVETSHARWGTSLGHIEYECKVPQNGMYVDVVRETIR